MLKTTLSHFNQLLNLTFLTQTSAYIIKFCSSVIKQHMGSNIACHKAKYKQPHTHFSSKNKEETRKKGLQSP